MVSHNYRESVGHAGTWSLLNSLLITGIPYVVTIFLQCVGWPPSAGWAEGGAHGTSPEFMST